MTGDQWQEVVEWIADRFPDSQWHAEQAVAYFFDVEAFDATDVWSAVFALYEKGLTFAPTGSQLLAGAYAERRETAMRDRYRGLPDTMPTQVTWDEYTINRFGERQSPMEVIRRLHAERTDCTNPGCDIHDNRKDNDDE
jgi:hypothetical protein